MPPLLGLVPHETLPISAWIYGDALSVPVLACPTRVPHPWPIIDALHDSLLQLRTAINRDTSVDR